jgi:hypothetical protein
MNHVLEGNSGKDRKYPLERINGAVKAMITGEEIKPEIVP